MRVKCSDPANCVVCSKSAADAGKKLRDEIGASSANAQSQGSVYAALSTYAASRSAALAEQAKWNDLRNELTVTETTTSTDGETKTVTKTVKTENGADKENQRVAQVMQQLGQAAQVQAQQQGSMVSTYVNAAAGALQKPGPATVLFAGQDPLK
jgi:hypothetical protein